MLMDDYLVEWKLSSSLIFSLLAHIVIVIVACGARRNNCLRFAVFNSSSHRLFNRWSRGRRSSPTAYTGSRIARTALRSCRWSQSSAWRRIWDGLSVKYRIWRHFVKVNDLFWLKLWSRSHTRAINTSFPSLSLSVALTSKSMWADVITDLRIRGAAASRR